MDDPAPIDNRPLIQDLDADRRAQDPDFTWFTVGQCEIIAPLAESVRNAEEAAR